MNALNDDEKAKVAHRLMRKLRSRQRLRLLADNPEPKTREEIELERLRAYLLDWRGRQQAGYPESGEPDSALANCMKSQSPQASELLAESDGWAMALIDASVDDLVGIKPDGALMRAALRVRWLNEGLLPDGSIKIRVFRSGRLHGMSMEEADALADRAERALLPIVKRKGLPL